MIKKIRFIICVAALPACLMVLINRTAAQYFDMEYYPITVLKTAATSSLVEKGKPEDYYSSDRALDNSSATAWCAASGKSGGEYLEAAFEARAFSGLAVLNGCGTTKKLYHDNNRIKEYVLTLYLKNGDKIVKKGTLSPKACNDEHPAVPNKSGSCYLEYNVGGEHIAFDRPLCLRGFRFAVVSVYKGNKYNDTCIAGIKRFSYRDSHEADYDGEESRKKAIIEAEACGVR